MTTNPTEIQRAYQSLIDHVVENRQNFCRTAAKDFTRMSPLNLEKILKLQIGMGASSLTDELLKRFDFAADTPTASAFDQQRHKLLYTAYEYIFDGLNRAFPLQNSFHGYHLPACDGSYLSIPPDPGDPDTFSQHSGEEKARAHYRLTAAFDLEEHRYAAMRCEPMKGKGEQECLVNMLREETFPEKTIFIPDRGYESWNLITRLAHEGRFFLMRIKSVQSHNGIASSLALPETDEFDETLTLNLTNSKAKWARELPGYHHIKHHVHMDFLTNTKDVFEVHLRFIQIAADTGKQVFVTNLPKADFPAVLITGLWRRRWDIETSFELLKHAIGLKAVHAKNRSFLLQEIYARFVTFNLCQLLMSSAPIKNVVGKKHKLRLDETIGVLLCREFLEGHIAEKALPILLRRHMYSERPGHGMHPRRIRRQAAEPFRYRAL